MMSMRAANMVKMGATRSMVTSRACATMVKEAAVESYSVPSSWMHWGMAAGMGVIVGTVKLSQWTPKDDPKKYGMSKGQLMNLHKSTAVLMAACIIPRIGMRLMSKTPPLPPGHWLEHLAAKATHFALYGFMLFLPATGIAMGYYGGKGIPFFGYKIPGASGENKDGAIAKRAFQLHKQAGNIFQYVVPLHIGATGFHLIKGHNLLSRFSLFGKAAK